jgi:RNA exonuclease 1
LIPKVVVIAIPGLSYDIYTQYINQLDILTKLNARACLTEAASTHSELASSIFLQNFFLLKERKRQKNTNTISATIDLISDSPTRLQPVKTSWTAEDFLLTREEMIHHEFPLEVKGSFVETKNFDSKHDMIGMDCEMCVTEQGFELTRITLVSRTELLYDSLVKPKSPIIDYVTMYSGINEEIMKDVTTTLEDVQAEILKIVSSKTILVGHSLENDLQKSKIVHRRILDTSILYPTGDSEGKRKFKLKNLAAMYLKRKIQTGDAGHDSVEDAKCALDLTLLKIKNGPEFGLTSAYKTITMFSLLNEHKKKTVMIDDTDALTTFSSATTHEIPCKNDQEVTSKAISAVKKTDYDFVWMRLKQLEIQTNLESILKINDSLTKILEAIPQNSLWIIITGYGNIKDIAVAKQKYGDGSTEMMEKIKNARNALSFFGIKE